MIFCHLFYIEAVISLCKANIECWILPPDIYMSIFFKNTTVTGDVIRSDNIEYSSHAFVEFVDEKNENGWILVTIYRIGK